MTSFSPLRQVTRTSGLLGLVVLVMLVAVLGGCGKRPGSVDPPPEVIDDKFPRIYPDPGTDPKP